jgi:hypothetical protein
LPKNQELVCAVIDSLKVQINMKTMTRKREGDMQVESYHWAGWANANIFCFMIPKSRATWCAISKLTPET